MGLHPQSVSGKGEGVGVQGVGVHLLRRLLLGRPECRQCRGEGAGFGAQGEFEW